MVDVSGVEGEGGGREEVRGEGGSHFRRGSLVGLCGGRGGREVRPLVKGLSECSRPLRIVVVVARHLRNKWVRDNF